MGSKGPKVINLSSAPPANYDALDDELDGRRSEEKKTPLRLTLVGSVKEKGFSADPLLRHRISLPQPRVTPFPVARHRSDGPHWGPTASKESSDAVIELNGDDEEGVGMPAAEIAVPLSRRKLAQSLTSKWRSTRKSELNISSQIQNSFDDSRLQSEPQETSRRTIIEERNHGSRRMESPKLVEVVAREENSIAKPMVEEGRSGTGGPYSKPAQQATQSGANGSTDRDIDAENRKTLFAMSPEAVAEAQAELSQKLRPELLEILRRRGAEKEKTRLAEKGGTSVPMKVSAGIKHPVGFLGNKKDVTEKGSPSPAEDMMSMASIQRGVERTTVSDDQIAFKRGETVRGTTAEPADLLTAAPSLAQMATPSKDLLTAAPSLAQMATPSKEAPEELTPPPPTTDPWTLRVEAVRSMRFDLNGNVISVEPSPPSNGPFPSNSASVPASILHNAFSVAERDFLRTEGDPVGAGYSLKETLALVRSTVPGQRAVALHLVASVLDKAIQGLQDEKLDPTSGLHRESVGGHVDWQPVWAYALGPEAELVLTLRLALDDGHSTVVAACARAIQALLSYSANESYFDSLEALWPGDKAVYTAPVFRRKTMHDEGFIGGGRWKYNVKWSEMFPFLLDTAAEEKNEEDGKDTVADDSHVSNKDVAAGLIRMGILPRIRYLLEVDQLIAAEEALLSVVICLARHSPTAANAVMTCPRLIDAILQRFIGTEKHLSEESWSARVKAIRLLKVLSQAKKANCVHFEKIGALQTVMRPLLHQSHASSLDQGYCEIMIETVRFWRVCIDYGIGILLFSDCYSTLCFWLLPLSKEEIIAARDEPLVLATESYLLLEHIARTLPLLHASGDLMAQLDGVNWSWSVAQAMLDTAMKWLSPECISGVCIVLERHVGLQSQPRIKIKSSARRILGIVASVLHFLATACAKIVSEKQLNCALEDPDNSPLPWLPTFLPQLGLALARSGLLNYSQLDLQSDFPESTLQSDISVSAMESTMESETPVSSLEKKSSFLECLRFCQTRADDESALLAVNCLNALVRVGGVVDSLIYIAKPKAMVPLEEQTLAHRVLERGLLLWAGRELRSALDLCKAKVVGSADLLQMTVRGGPAPGVGIGWGSFCGGAWSKHVMIAQSSARLALDLMSVFSSRVWLSHSDDEGDVMIEESEPPKQLPWSPSSQVNFCLSIISTATIANRELVLRACSSTIFHPSTLSILMQKIEEVLANWKASTAREEGFEVDSPEVKTFDPDSLSRTLLTHCESFWLPLKTRKGKEAVSPYKGPSKRKSNGLGPQLAVVEEEESGAEHMPHPETLMTEWTGQRLPLPSHWVLSPLLGNPLPATTKKHGAEYGADSVIKETAEIEEVVTAGLAFFLGLEVLASSISDAEPINTKIPLVRKIHSLSTVFVSGGDVFLDPSARDLIGALQNLIGDQIGRRTADLPQHSSAESLRAREDGRNGSNAQSDEAATVTQDETTVGEAMDSDSIMTRDETALDFEGCIDASYLNYAEMVAEQFVATSFGSHVFGRQVAFHLCGDAPAMIRLAIWRVLTDGKVLELLPPLTKCAGPPQNYLYPFEADQQILESFVRAWSSGGLDKAAKRNSLSFTLALHHLAGCLSDASDAEETLLLKKKLARALVRSTVRKSDRQKMLSRLVHYVPAMSPSTSEQVPDGAGAEQMELTLSLLLKASEGDSSLIAEVQRLQKFAVSRV